MEAAPGTVRIWDLGVRVFHWTAALLVVVSVVTAKVGGSLMLWHQRSGYAILALVTFRILWGLAGPTHARFASFVHGPRAALAYVKSVRKGVAGAYAGHNPLGAYSVLALLAVLLLQATTGLFSTDDIAEFGPLTKLVSNAFIERATAIHHLNEKVIYALVALHLAAIGYYTLVKREGLVRAMITGDKQGIVAAASADDTPMRIRAAIFAALAAALVGVIVTL
jgi:cytochrome b